MAEPGAGKAPPWATGTARRRAMMSETANRSKGEDNSYQIAFFGQLPELLPLVGPGERLGRRGRLAGKRAELLPAVPDLVGQEPLRRDGAFHGVGVSVEGAHDVVPARLPPNPLFAVTAKAISNQGPICGGASSTFDTNAPIISK